MSPNHSNENGKILEQILDSPRFLLVNDDTPTFSLNYRDYSSCLDLFIISNNLGSFLNSFTVSDDDLTSDHFPIQLELSFKFVNSSKFEGNRPNYGKADWGKFKGILEFSNINFESENINEINKLITSTILNAVTDRIPRLPSKKFKNSLPKKIVSIILKRKGLKKIKKKNGRNKI